MLLSEQIHMIGMRAHNSIHLIYEVIREASEDWGYHVSDLIVRMFNLDMEDDINVDNKQIRSSYLMLVKNKDDLNKGDDKNI